MSKGQMQPWEVNSCRECLGVDEMSEMRADLVDMCGRWVFVDQIFEVGDDLRQVQAEETMRLEGVHLATRYKMVV